MTTPLVRIAAVASGIAMAWSLHAFCLAPAHAAMNFGNYNLNIPARYDFHTWIWSISPCADGCVTVFAISQPVARAFTYRSTATLTEGRYSTTVDVPDGLRCGNVYYGSIVATRDVYTWDAATLTGTLTSSFDSGCDGRPGTLTYPFSLTRM